MIKINVWLTDLEGRTLSVGELVVASPDENGALRGQFRYDPEYLQGSSAIALDPIHLRLSDRIFDANRPYAGVHGVFEDSLPDDWGRKIMIRLNNLSRNKQRVPQLLQLLSNQGLGALSYTEKGRPELRKSGVSSRHL